MAWYDLLHGRSGPKITDVKKKNHIGRTVWEEYVMQGIERPKDIHRLFTIGIPC